ncbi:MAG TPA: hypothetical protein VF981_11440 [Gemmatimonadaceae bacterium]|jgi:hypothetical protein
MDTLSTDLASRLAAAIAECAGTTDPLALHDRLEALARAAAPDEIVAAAEPYRNEPDVIAPLYEAIIAAEPSNARALVVLANAWWLQGRGPQPVGELATRAIAAEPANRGAWHLWALSESDPLSRMRRWQQVTERFPEDDLALAALADNATAVAGAEHDYRMLDFAIETYERLLRRSTDSVQRDAVTAALGALRGWHF